MRFIDGAKRIRALFNASVVGETFVFPEQED